MRPLRRLDAAIDDVGSVRAIAVLRILLGPITLLHLRPFIDDVRAGVHYADRFYEPYWDWFPEAGPDLYAGLVVAAATACATMTIGLFSRLSTGLAALFVGYNLALSTTHFHHNRAFLLLLLTGVTLLHPGDHLSVDALLRRFRRRPHLERDPTRRATPRPVPLWPLYLLRVLVATVYLASATSKLVDGDWWGGRVLQLRAINSRAIALSSGAPAWSIDLLSDATFQWWFSKTAVLTEFLIGFGLLHRRTRLLAVWIAVWFHLSIEITARVQVFSWAALAALCIWVTPSERDRELIVPRQHRLGSVVTWLDWFGRFDLHRDDGQRVTLIDRASGERPAGTCDGRAAELMTLSRLPVTFMLAAPAVAISKLAAMRPVRPFRRA